MGPQGDRDHAPPRDHTSWGVGGPTTPHRVPRGVLHPGDQAPACALAPITSGRAGYHLELAMLRLSQWIKQR